MYRLKLAAVFTCCMMMGLSALLAQTPQVKHHLNWAGKAANTIKDDNMPFFSEWLLDKENPESDSMWGCMVRIDTLKHTLLAVMELSPQTNDENPEATWKITDAIEVGGLTQQQMDWSANAMCCRDSTGKGFVSKPYFALVKSYDGENFETMMQFKLDVKTGHIIAMPGNNEKFYMDGEQLGPDDDGE